MIDVSISTEFHLQPDKCSQQTRKKYCCWFHANVRVGTNHKLEYEWLEILSTECRRSINACSLFRGKGLIATAEQRKKPSRRDEWAKKQLIGMERRVAREKYLMRIEDTSTVCISCGQTPNGLLLHVCLISLWVDRQRCDKKMTTYDYHEIFKNKI